MKKSIKKACAFALLATSMTSVASAGAVLYVDSKNASNNNIVFAEEVADADRKVLSVDGSKTTVVVGEEFTVPQAKFRSNGTDSDVTYKVTSPLGEEVTVTSGKFKVNRIGQYVIEYTYTESGKTYSAKYYVNAEVGETTIEVVENTQRILPKYVYESYTGDLYIPKVEVKDEDDEVVEDCVVDVKVTSPNNNSLTYDETTGKLNYTSLEQGTYSVQYTARTSSGVFLKVKTLEFTVLSDTEFEKEYKKDYTLNFELSTTAPTSADIGSAITIPSVEGKMGSTSTSVYYTVDVYLVAGSKEVDVTAQTLTENYTKFTAKKKYTVDGKDYDATNATYQFYYNVKDALGKSAERTGFRITGVKDTKAPEIVIADGYDKNNVPSEVENVSYKIQQNYEHGENIVLKAIYATDLGDDFSDLTLKRWIRKSSSSSSEQDVWADAEDGSTFSKDIVFNLSGSLGENQLEGKDSDGNVIELKSGESYTMYYKAVDKAGNDVQTSYTFTVDSSFVFTSEDKPTVEFLSDFQKSMSSGSKISFGEPKSSAKHDDDLYNAVYYKFSNDTEWTKFELNDDSKYELKLNKEGATSVKIRAIAENDAPEIDGTEIIDGVKAYLKLDDMSTYAGFKYGYAEVEIKIVDNQDTSAPTLKSIDKVETSYVQNSEITLPQLTIADDLVDYVNVDIFVRKLADDGSVEKTFDVYDATIVRVKGSGEDTYTLKDAKFYATVAGNYEIIYQVTDAGNNLMNIYQYTEVTESGSVSDPKFSKLPSALNDGKLELGEEIELPVPTLPGSDYEYSVNAKGPLGYTLNKEKFIPTKAGTYTIIYTMYDINEPNTVIDTKEFVVKVEDSTKPTVYVDWNLDASYEVGKEVLIPVFSASDLSGINYEDSKIVISSKSYSRTIKGSDMAKLLKQYNEYVDAKEADPNTGKTAGDLFVKLRYNEEYTITYTVYDNSDNKNSTVVSYTIKVGDLVAPVLDIKDDIVPTTMKLDETLTIDTSKISVSDDKDSSLSVSDVTIVVKNTTTNVTLENNFDDESGKFAYNIETAGEYSVTFTVKDAAGNKREVTRTFTVNAEENNGLETSEVIAIVACCIAVLILAGAIVYMILTKKKIKSYK